MKRSMVAAIALLLGQVSADAADLAPPTGAVILTVTGAIANTNDGGAAAFDMAALEALTGRSGIMETPWTSGMTEFSGPLLRSLLDAVGAHGRTVRLVALNDYAADIPLEDATELDTILATRMNGKLMSVRDKGPLFLIYPFDRSPDLYNEKYFSRSVWQIKELEVVE